VDAGGVVEFDGFVGLVAPVQGVGEGADDGRWIVAVGVVVGVGAGFGGAAGEAATCTVARAGGTSPSKNSE